MSKHITLNKENIAKWFLNNFRTHSDWTGTYVEYDDHMNSVKELIDKFFTDMQED